ncbi:segregation/condensation protein A [Ferviditalea candida]|uniref:Segregation and condensation protein A n=1 Tax=Ferviditalea candida TaxID=3108399 RepID=A0ABU5ZKK1_9BACL|nr:segregation/condensation protein A [Paenibacillaceae bacterium T2]
MPILYRLESFEGPLDLLLHLIDKAEIDIYNIPISEITDQYLEYVNAMQELQLDAASEFLVMAATLLSIKSRMLLPKPPVIDIESEDYDPDLDPRAELVQKLIEYRKFKAVSEFLREQELRRSLIYSREPVDLTPYAVSVSENPVKGFSTFDLIVAFQKALRKASSRDRVAKIERDEISIKDRLDEIVTSLYAQDGKLLFSDFFSPEATRREVVVTFLAILELMKMRKILCYQHRLFEDIVIELRKEGEAIG